MTVVFTHLCYSCTFYLLTCLTVNTSESCWTRASVPIHIVSADTSVSTGRAQALIDICNTIGMPQSTTLSHLSHEWGIWSGSLISKVMYMCTSMDCFHCTLLIITQNELNSLTLYSAYLGSVLIWSKY